MRRSRLVIPEEIREYVHYDPTSGALTRKLVPGPRRGRPRVEGAQYTSKDGGGAFLVSHKSLNYQAHRVAWFLVTGQQPNVIDHINGNKTDNRWVNLRNTTYSKNNQNQRCHREWKPVGVSWDCNVGKFRARLPVEYSFDRKQKFIGLFDTVEEAAQAVLDAITETPAGSAPSGGRSGTR